MEKEITMSVRVKSEFAEKIFNIARREECPYSYILRRAIKYYLESENEKNK